MSVFLAELQSAALLLLFLAVSLMSYRSALRQLERSAPHQEEKKRPPAVRRGGYSEKE